jgi:tetratricopeptide (TPR) repeat protein
LAKVLFKTQGKYAEAEPLYQRSLEIKEKTLGENHSSVAIGLNNLAELYKTQGKISAAEPLLISALMILEKSLGETHPTTKIIRGNLEALQAAKK